LTRFGSDTGTSGSRRLRSCLRDLGSKTIRFIVVLVYVTGKNQTIGLYFIRARRIRGSIPNSKKDEQGRQRVNKIKLHIKMSRYSRRGPGGLKLHEKR